MRCYNGAPDSELKALWDAQDAARAKLAKAGLHATYFPVEGKWMVFTLDSREVTGFHRSLISAAEAAGVMT